MKQMPSRCGGRSIHRLHLCWGVRQSQNEFPGYDIKQSDGEASVMMEFGGIQNIPSLPSLLDPLWPWLVASDRFLSKGQKEVNCVYAKLNCLKYNCFLTLKLRTYAKVNCLKWKYFCMLNRIIWNRIIFDIEIVLPLNLIVWNRTVLTFNCV